MATTHPTSLVGRVTAKVLSWLRDDDGGNVWTDDDSRAWPDASDSYSGEEGGTVWRMFDVRVLRELEVVVVRRQRGAAGRRVWQVAQDKLAESLIPAAGGIADDEEGDDTTDANSCRALFAYNAAVARDHPVSVVLRIEEGAIQLIRKSIQSIPEAPGWGGAS